MPAPEIVEVCSRGDVMLVCGTTSNQTKIRVSSIVLSETSAVFRALLSPSFKEGTQLAATSSVEIPFPDDDVDGLVILCNVLHVKNNNVPQTLEVPQISTVASLTDKYACMEGTKFVSRTWISPHIGSGDSAMLGSLLNSAYLFKDEYSFALVAEALVWRSVGSIQSNISGQVITIQNTLLYLDNQRLRTQGQIADAVESVVETVVRRKCNNTHNNCEMASACFANLIKQLSSKQLLPYRRRERKSIAELIEALSTFEFSASSEGYRPRTCGYASCSAQIHEDFINAELKQSMATLKSAIQAPCIRCVQEGEVGSGKLCGHKLAGAEPE